MVCLRIISIILPFLIEASFAADCYQPRPSSSPAGIDLANFIQSRLAAACLAISSNVTGTAYTHLDDYFILSNYTATSDPPIVPPNNFTLCTAALQQIIQQCIFDQDSYGGDFVLYEQTYNITNNAYPSNPVSQTLSSSTAAPSPTVVPASSITTTSTVSSTSAAGPVATAAHVAEAVAAAVVAAALLAKNPTSSALAATAHDTTNAALLAAQVAFVGASGGALFSFLSDLVTHLLVASQAATTAVAAVAAGGGAVTGGAIAVAVAGLAAGLATVATISAAAEEAAQEEEEENPEDFKVLIDDLRARTGETGYAVQEEALGLQLFAVTLPAAIIQELIEPDPNFPGVYHPLIETLCPDHPQPQKQDPIEVPQPINSGSSDSDSSKRSLNKRDAIQKQRNIYDLGLTSLTPGPVFEKWSWAWWLSKWALAPPAPEYLYHESAGEGTTIYIYDSGLNARHIDFLNTDKSSRSIDWIHPTVDGTGPEDDYDGHGTCVASKAAGSIYGVAKKANLVIVRDSEESKSAIAFIDGFVKIFQHARTNGLFGKAVINLSLVYALNGLDRTALSIFKSAIKEMINQGLIIFCATGNSGKNALVTGYPAAFADAFLPIILVGATDVYGSAAEFSSGQPEISAAGKDVWCASGKGTIDFVSESGTSFSSPAVAGLAAYFLAHPSYRTEFEVPLNEISRQVEGVIHHFSQQRQNDGPRVAYNNIHNEMDVACEIAVPGGALARIKGRAPCSSSQSSLEMPTPPTALPSIETWTATTISEVSPTIGAPQTPGSTFVTTFADPQSSSQTLPSNPSTNSDAPVPGTSTQASTMPPATLSTIKTETKSSDLGTSITLPTIIITSPPPAESSDETPIDLSTIFPFPTSEAAPTTAQPEPTGIVVCLQQRPAGAPSGDQVANALTGENLPGTACAASFDQGDGLSETFYHGSLSVTVQRGYVGEELAYCNEGLSAIIDACIRYGEDYGGTYMRGDQAFAISNTVFPSNPLVSADSGGPPPVGVLSCFDQRPSGAPSGDQVANALTKAGKIDSICGTDFNTLSITFNYGQILMTLTRAYDGERLTYCSSGLNAIIDGCIRYNGWYSGTYAQGDQTFQIKNNVYPFNPLTENDEGGPAAPTPSNAPPAPPPAGPPYCDGAGNSIPPRFLIGSGSIIWKTASEILYSMRDQACQNLCQSLADIPSNLVTATRNGDTGCTYRVRITALYEIFFTSPSSGQACYDKTDAIIRNCIPWNLEGVNTGQAPYWQLGTRRVSPVDPDVLPYRRLWYTDVYITYLVGTETQVHTAQWDDGEGGISLYRAMSAACGSDLGAYYWGFSDQFFARSDPYETSFYEDHRATFNLGGSVEERNCRRRVVEKVLGFPQGILGDAPR